MCLFLHLFNRLKLTLNHSHRISDIRNYIVSYPFSSHSFFIKLDTWGLEEYEKNIDPLLKFYFHCILILFFSGVYTVSSV